MELIEKNDPSQLKDNPRVWLIFLILLPVLINTIRNPANDFGTITAIVRDWMAGRTPLYSAGSPYFSYLPWALFVYLPLAYIPHPFGQLIFNTISLSLLIWSTWYVARPATWRVLAIALTTIYTCTLIIQGQYDALVLASLTLGWIACKRKNPWLLGMAIVGLTSKYSYILLPSILLITTLREWPLKKIIYASIIPLIVFGSSFLLAGWDWPQRYSRLMNLQLDIYSQYEMVTVFTKTSYPVSYWLIHPPVGYIILVAVIVVSLYLIFRLSRGGVNQRAIYFALALNLAISPYFSFHHGIYLAPIHAQLLKDQRVWGYILTGCAILDIIFLWIGVGLITYPLATLTILTITTLRGMKGPTAVVLKPADGKA